MVPHSKDALTCNALRLSSLMALSDPFVSVEGAACAHEETNLTTVYHTGLACYLTERVQYFTKLFFSLIHSCRPRVVDQTVTITLITILCIAFRCQ